ncbi:MAG TPA: Asp23/Gls24 family envelope stress response protein [Actinoallomurus sp.]|jgi:uncharacterized alkaline shock family protein YloU
MTEFADGTQPPEQVEEQVNVVVADHSADAQPAQLTAQVKGRIDIEDEVVEKVAGLAAIEVDGVADLGGDVARAVENVREHIGVGHRRGDQGVKADIEGHDVTIEVTIVIEYGHVVMDVARDVKANVATQTSRMLGLRVVEVNVVVDDVRLPEPPKPAPEAEEEHEHDQRLTIG